MTELFAPDLSTPEAVPAGQPDLPGLIKKYADKHGVDYDLAYRVVYQESKGNPKATSEKGAMGLMQLMPDTASDLGVQNPYDPEESLDAGLRYLRQQYDTFKNWGAALAAYNAGPKAVKKGAWAYEGYPGYKQTRDYVKAILGEDLGGRVLAQAQREDTQPQPHNWPNYDDKGRQPDLGRVDMPIETTANPTFWQGDYQDAVNRGPIPLDKFVPGIRNRHSLWEMLVEPIFDLMGIGKDWDTGGTKPWEARWQADYLSRLENGQPIHELGFRQALSRFGAETDLWQIMDQEATEPVLKSLIQAQRDHEYHYRRDSGFPGEGPFLHDLKVIGQNAVNAAMFGIPGKLMEAAGSPIQEPLTTAGAVGSGLGEAAGFIAGPGKAGSRLYQLLPLSGSRWLPQQLKWAALLREMGHQSTTMAMAMPLGNLAESLDKSPGGFDLFRHLLTDASMGGLIGAIYPGAGFLSSNRAVKALTAMVLADVAVNSGRSTIPELVMGIMDGSLSTREIAIKVSRLATDAWFGWHQMNRGNAYTRERMGRFAEDILGIPAKEYMEAVHALAKSRKLGTPLDRYQMVPMEARESLHLEADNLAGRLEGQKQSGTLDAGTMTDFLHEQLALVRYLRPELQGVYGDAILAATKVSNNRVEVLDAMTDVYRELRGDLQGRSGEPSLVHTERPGPVAPPEPDTEQTEPSVVTTVPSRPKTGWEMAKGLVSAAWQAKPRSRVPSTDAINDVFRAIRVMVQGYERMPEEKTIREKELYPEQVVRYEYEKGTGRKLPVYDVGGETGKSYQANLVDFNKLGREEPDPQVDFYAHKSWPIFKGELGGDMNVHEYVSALSRHPEVVAWTTQLKGKTIGHRLNKQDLLKLETACAVASLSSKQLRTLHDYSSQFAGQRGAKAGQLPERIAGAPRSLAVIGDGDTPLPAQALQKLAGRARDIDTVLTGSHTDQDLQISRALGTDKKPREKPGERWATEMREEVEGSREGPPGSLPPGAVRGADGKLYANTAHTRIFGFSERGGSVLGDAVHNDYHRAIGLLEKELGSKERAERFWDLWQRKDAETAEAEFGEYAGKGQDMLVQRTAAAQAGIKWKDVEAKAEPDPLKEVEAMVNRLAAKGQNGVLVVAGEGARTQEAIRLAHEKGVTVFRLTEDGRYEVVRPEPITVPGMEQPAKPRATARDRQVLELLDSLNAGSVPEMLGVVRPLVIGEKTMKAAKLALGAAKDALGAVKRSVTVPDSEYAKQFSMYLISGLGERRETIHYITERLDPLIAEGMNLPLAEFLEFSDAMQSGRAVNPKFQMAAELYQRINKLFWPEYEAMQPHLRGKLQEYYLRQMWLKDKESGEMIVVQWKGKDLLEHYFDLPEDQRPAFLEALASDKKYMATLEKRWARRSEKQAQEYQEEMTKEEQKHKRLDLDITKQEPLGARHFKKDASFLEEKHIPDYRTGVLLGLLPRDTNPFMLLRRDLIQKQRWLMDARLVTFALKENMAIADDLPVIRNLVQDNPDKVLLTGRAAEMFEAVYNDLHPPTILKEGEPGKPSEIMPRGFLVHRDVALLLDRTFGASLFENPTWGGSYRQFRTFTDLVRKVQVGLSFFHFTMVTGNLVAQGAGQGFVKGLGEIASGQLPREGAKQIGKALAIYPEVKDIMKRAREQITKWYDNPELAPYVQEYVKAGGRLPDIEAVKPFSEALTDAVGRIWGQGEGTPVGKAIDSIAWGLMGYYVPMAKLGSFLKLREIARNEIDTKFGELPEGPDKGVLKERAYLHELQKITEHLDNIQGQVVYDNLPMKRALRDALFLGFNYPGWSLGSYRWMYHAARGSVKDFRAVVESMVGREVQFQFKTDAQAKQAMTYAVGMLLQLAVYNTVFNLFMTGGELPDHRDILIGPRTGRILANGAPERLRFAGYQREVLEAATIAKYGLTFQWQKGAAELANLVSSKELFLIQQLAEFARGVDYFGNEIVDPNSNFLERGYDMGKHFTQSLVPMTVRQAWAGREVAKSPLVRWGGFLGISRVPKHLSGDAMTETLDRYFETKAGRMILQADQPRREVRDKVVGLVESGDLAGAQTALMESLSQGTITRRQMNGMQQEIRLHMGDPVHGAIRTRFARVDDLGVAAEAYKLADPVTRQALLPILVKKWSNAAPETKSKHLEAYMEAIGK